MKLTHSQTKPGLFNIEDLDEDTIVGLANVAINYNQYLKELLSKSDKEVLVFAPNKTAADARNLLKMQSKACEDYIQMMNDESAKASQVSRKKLN